MTANFDLKNFRFVENIETCPVLSAFIARIPAGIENRIDLFQDLSNQLKFPDYFGFNWDALSECLHDFYWITSKVICIIHEDLPKLDKRELNLYLSILSDSIIDWKSEEDHQLEVIFPSRTKGLIASLLDP